MYDLTIVYNDFKPQKIEIEDEELDKVLNSIRNNQVYFDENKTVGFWLPPTSLRCLYVNKRVVPTQTKEEPCQNQKLEAEIALQS